MIVVFDLDNTLYEELTYVKSGFGAVSNFMRECFSISRKESFEAMMEALESNGRGKVFDKVLDRYKLNNKRNVRKCVSIYRLHMPNITLTASARRCLERFSHVPKYVVTDDNKIAQENKVKALNLAEWMECVFCTHQYGLQYAKPSPYIFEKIAAIENSPPGNIVYVADNPHKDFVGIKPLGFKAIRVRTGIYRFEKLDVKHEAHLTVNSLDEINVKILSELGVT